MPRDNRCMYVVHVCFYVCCSDCVGVCGNVWCVVSFCLPHPVAVSAFMICRDLCACTEMLWMCVLYVSFGSKVRHRTCGCIAMGSALLCIFMFRLLYILQGLAWTECKLFYLDLVWDCFVLSRQKPYVGMVVYISWLHSCLCVDVMVMSST